MIIKQSYCFDYVVNYVILVELYEVVYLTFPPYIFTVKVKSAACYITGQWGRVHSEIK